MIGALLFRKEKGRFCFGGGQLDDSMKNCQIFRLPKTRGYCKEFVKLHKFCEKMSKIREGGKISYPHEKSPILL